MIQSLVKYVVGRVRILGDNDGTAIGNLQNYLRVLVAGRSRTSGNPVDLNIDDLGNLIITALTGFGADFAFGLLAHASVNVVPVRKTAYTEQAANAQRSIASASASDAAAGTGARTVEITYLDSTGAGPYTETVTLNGTTGVNTVSTTICFIEKIKVLTVGSGLSNAGIITLYAATAKGGGAIATIAVGDNRTYWAHHYVPTGKTANITGVAASNDQTTASNSAFMLLKSQAIGVANAADLQVGDYVRVFGQSSNVYRAYASPIKVVGPARVVLHVAPQTNTSQTTYGSFDFFEP